MDNLNKILDIVEKTDKEIIIVRENGECFVISKFSDFEKLEQEKLNFGSKSLDKSEDNYANLVKKIIMP